MSKNRPELDPEIVEELVKLNEHFRMKGEMSDPKYKATLKVSDSRHIRSSPQFPGTVLTSRGIEFIGSSLNIESPLTKLEHNLFYKDHIFPTMERTASKLREKLKDRYPEQYEEWKLGTEAYHKKYPSKKRK